MVSRGMAWPRPDAQMTPNRLDIIAYNIRMADEKAAEDKFDAVLRRMLDMKPMTAKELSAKLKAEKAAKKSVQKLDKPRSQG